jgi:hypothetical protein
MDILRIAYTSRTVHTKRILGKISKNDADINDMLKRLSK